MRGGKFLAEESPETLMQMYQSDSLENVFLKLSLAQIQGKRRRSIYLKEVAGSEDPAGVSIFTVHSSSSALLKSLPAPSITGQRTR